MMTFTQNLIAKSLDGSALSGEESRRILSASGAELSMLMAGAHQIKETYLGNRIDLCSIINAKSGRCSENCSFCAQSAHHQTNAPVYPLKSVEEIVQGAHTAEAEGNHCYGIVTSGTRIEPGDEFDKILTAIRAINAETSIEPSASLGILDSENAQALKQAGCVTYHHNLETARSFFPHICTTHDYEDDVETIRQEEIRHECLLRWDFRLGRIPGSADRAGNDLT